MAARLNWLPALALACGLAWCAWAPDARAAESCTVSALGVAFGAYDITSASATDGSGQITVDCQANPITVTIAVGTGGGGAFNARRMILSGTPLNYQLYTDPGRTVVWGDGSAGTSTVACTTDFTSNGCIGSNPSGGIRRAVRAIYGRIPALQNVGFGTYTDAVQVTITF
jgi:spore coat protein U-like protein